MRLAILTAVGLFSAASASAAVLNATPDTFENVVGRARGGDTVVLAAGQYDTPRIAKRHFDPPVKIDASRARIVGLTIVDSDGFEFEGGTFLLPPPGTNPKTGNPSYGSAFRTDSVDRLTVRHATFIGPGKKGDGGAVVYGEGYGFFVNGGRDINLESATMTGFKSSAVINRVDGFHVSDITFTWMRSDGLDIAESRHGLVEGVTCHDTLIRDAEHPDCIQMWSRPTSPPTADILIRRTKAVGNTQGITGFNHVRDGVDDGGFDRITIEDNDVNVSYPHGISIVSARDSVIRRNRVQTFGNGRYHATIHATGVRTCGNVVEPSGGKPGYSDGKC
jgi:hypothetical protein